MALDSALDPTTRRWALVLAGWTLLTWVTRVPLAWSDPDLEVGDKVTATIPVLVFVVLGVAVAIAVVRRAPVAATLAAGLSLWGIGYWAVRLALIVSRDHPVGFVVVHAVLAVVAAGLGALVLRGLASNPTRVSNGV